MRHFIRWALLVSCLFVMGCGSEFTPKGKIVKGGQPFTVSNKGTIIMTLLKDGQSYAANVDYQKGTFDVRGPGGKGLTAGTYKVAIQAFDPFEGMSKEKDLFKGAYTGDQNLLTTEVVNASTEVVIDVGKK